VDFAGSDTAMTDEEAKVKQVYCLYPQRGGAVAVVYNIPGVTNLKLSARCFKNLSGQITNGTIPRLPR